MHVRIAVSALIVATAISIASSAWADGTGSGDNRGWTDGGSIGATAKSGVDPVGASATAPSAAPVCTYESLSADEAAMAEDAATMGLGAEKGAGPGVWVRKICTDANGKRSGVVIWAPRPAAPNTADLAQQALSLTALPLPALG